ncbi:hypothetical protein BGX26_004324 [Mortierella sp. AD094]|nr:hypothetical protein BGX26_004324 [Mortierella sp. AD094]
MNMSSPPVEPTRSSPLSPMDKKSRAASMTSNKSEIMNPPKRLKDPKQSKQPNVQSLVTMIDDLKKSMDQQGAGFEKKMAEQGEIAAENKDVRSQVRGDEEEEQEGEDFSMKL